MRARPKYFKYLFMLLLVSSLLISPVPKLVLADSKSDILDSVNSVDDGSSPSVDNAIAAAINVFTLIVGVTAVVMMILSGYKYITSAGDSGKVAQAKSTALYALIGVSLVIISQVLLRFAIAKSTNVSSGGSPSGGSIPCIPGNPC